MGCGSAFLPCLWDGVDPGNINSIQDGLQVVANVIKIMMALSGYLAVLFLIIGGIMYIISSGDPARINQAKSTIFYSIAGLVISMLALTLVSFISGSF